MTSPTADRRWRPTLESVAARAGVSRSTVSRVINGAAGVALPARRAVERAVEELGYAPNQAARALTAQPSGLVTVVVAEPPSVAFDCPTTAQLLEGIRQELSRAGAGFTVVATTPDDRGFDAYQAHLVGGSEDGVILLSLRTGNPLPRALTRAGMPAVSFGRVLEPDRFLPYADSANREGAALGVQWLLDRGRRRIGTIAGPQDMPSGIERLAGYRAALDAASRPAVVEVGDFTQPGGERAMAALLAQQPQLDAVFVANDEMALGALRTLRQAGRSVPDDVAIVGFDDIDSASVAEPALTTVRQPLVKIGRALVQLVGTRPRRSARAGDPVILPTELVVRQSA